MLDQPKPVYQRLRDVIANANDDHKARVFEQGLRDKTDRYLLKLRKPK